MCTFVDVEKPTSANVPIPDGHGSALKQIIIDWETNVLFMLSFLSVGDGGTEITRVLGMLGLPDATTFGPQLFGILEEYVGPVLQEVANELVCSKILLRKLNMLLARKRMMTIISCLICGLRRNSHSICGQS